MKGQPRLAAAHRRWLIATTLAVVAAVAVAACGSAGSSGPPLQTELSYLSADSPLVLTVQTDPNSTAVKNALGFLNRFAFAPVLESAVITRLRQAGVDYDSDVKPLFGNPIAVALTGMPFGRSGRREYVAAWVTHDATALNSLISRSSSGLRKVGSRDGATLYLGSNTSAAVSGPTLVLGSTLDLVTAALDRHASGGGITSSTYSKAAAGLPGDALVSMFGDLKRVLAASSSSIGAARVPWVAAIRSFGASLSLTPAGMRINYRVETSGSALSLTQLPIAPGSASPQLAAGFPLTAGVRDLRHVVTFALASEQAAHSARYAAFQRREARLRSRTGANVTDLMHQLTGGLVAAGDGHANLFRVAVNDPVTTGKVLARLARDPRDVFNGSATVSRAGNLYVVHRAGGSTETVGVVSGQLVGGAKATPAQVLAFATAPTAPAAGSRGSVAFSVSLSALIGLASHRAGPQVPSALLRSLTNLTGWLSATASALQGQAVLSFR